MSVTTESHIKVLGRWVRVPNALIVERKSWSTSRKNRARDNAELLGQAQTFVMTSWVYPVFVIVALVAGMAVVGAIETGM